MKAAIGQLRYGFKPWSLLSAYAIIVPIVAKEVWVRLGNFSRGETYAEEYQYAGIHYAVYSSN
jgi:hypothetical protein